MVVVNCGFSFGGLVFLFWIGLGMVFCAASIMQKNLGKLDLLFNPAVQSLGGGVLVLAECH